MFFKWQRSYGDFTVSRWDVERVTRYVKRKKDRHCGDDLIPEWEEFFVEITPHNWSSL